MIASFRDSFPDAVVILISVQKKEARSLQHITWMHQLEVSGLFLEILNLYEYQNIELVKDRIEKFANSNFLTELLKQVPLPRDERMLFKLVEQTETINPSSPNKRMSMSPRKM